MTTAGSPVHILAFDHRQVLRNLLGLEGEAPEDQQLRLADGKAVVVEALQILQEHGLSGVGVLLDEEYGAEAARAAKQNDIRLSMPVEASRTEILRFQYGDDYGEHILRFDPDIVKLLVFHNPGDPQERIEKQLALALEVSQWCEANDYAFMVELLVHPTADQDAAIDGDRERFTNELHTELLRSSIEQFQLAGIEPDLWKIEGLPGVEDFEVVAAQARSGDRNDVGLVVLGNGASLERVQEWLRMAASVEGFVGFAVGRSIWHDPLRSYYFEGAGREETVQRIADAFAALVRSFEDVV